MSEQERNDESSPPSVEEKAKWLEAIESNLKVNILPALECNRQKILVYHILCTSYSYTDLPFVFKEGIVFNKSEYEYYADKTCLIPTNQYCKCQRCNMETSVLVPSKRKKKRPYGKGEEKKSILDKTVQYILKCHVLVAKNDIVWTTRKTGTGVHHVLVAPLSSSCNACWVQYKRKFGNNALKRSSFLDVLKATTYDGRTLDRNFIKNELYQKHDLLCKSCPFDNTILALYIKMWNNNIKDILKV